MSFLGSLSVPGVIYGVVSSSMVALNAIYIKKILPRMDDNIWKLTYYNNVNASILFIPLVIFSEVRIFYFCKSALTIYYHLVRLINKKRN